jgi:predicted metalloprotease with PDZ domain
MTKKKIWMLVMMITALAAAAYAQGKRKQFSARVSLTDIADDRLKVEMDIPRIKKSSVLFQFPKMVPGIYGTLNFGLNIDTVWAIDRRGRKVILSRKDTNSWVLNNPGKYRKLYYSVNDDYEDLSTYKGMVYNSARSIFTAGQLFMINNNSVFGYIKGYEKTPYQIRFSKPASLVGVSSLKLLESSDTSVLFAAGDYGELVDNPLMFAPPDTTSILLDEVKVTVSAYSTSGKKISPRIAAEITPLLKLQKAYLGGKLPVSQYNFLLYHFAAGQPRPSFGEGLEHSQSTVILLHMMMDDAAITDAVYGIASHEFLHTIMPLALHAEEIEYYDFSGPVMSQHLWLYEGMTEYFTMHIPVKQGAITLEKFTATIEEKISTMKQFDSSLSLTSLSKNAVQRQDQYMNIYSRGPLVCMCLDMELRKLSDGAYGVQELIRDLLKEYGVHKPFKDDELFDKIIDITGKPQLQHFFDAYIKGNKLPPLREYLKLAGMKLSDDDKIKIDANPSPEQLRFRKAWVGLF